MPVKQPVIRGFSDLFVELVQLQGIPVDMAVSEGKAYFQIIGTGQLNLPQERLDQTSVGVFYRINDIEEHKYSIIIHIDGFNPVGLAADFRGDVHNRKFVCQQIGRPLIP
ncbi:hypothetical protein D3C74_459140 [compost metagenome]